MDEILDRAVGPRHLADTAAAAIVESTLKFFDGDRYELRAWCVMPNHVHVLAKIFGEEPHRIIKSWKTFSALKINALLSREGSLWQRDYFDCLVRDDREISKYAEYIRRNPLQAGLSDWRFVWVAPDVPPCEP
jgi:REP element-mobilizing transposase RayT